MRLYGFMNRHEICLANLALISSRQMHMQQCVHFPRRHNKKRDSCHAQISFLSYLIPFTH